MSLQNLEFDVGNGGGATVVTFRDHELAGTEHISPIESGLLRLVDSGIEALILASPHAEKPALFRVAEVKTVPVIATTGAKACAHRCAATFPS